MKFGIKILVCNLVIMLLLFSIGGGLLVWHSYTLAVESEVNNGIEENQLLRSAMEISVLRQVAFQKMNTGAIIVAAAKDISYGINGTRACLFLADSNGQEIYRNDNAQSGQDIVFSDLTNQLELGKKNYQISQDGGIYHLYTAGRMDIDNASYYLITQRDITDVYKNIEKQFSYYRVVLICLVAACSLILLFIFRILTRSIRELDKSTEKIMQGDYSVHLNIRSSDEIGALGKKFTKMAEAIETHVQEVEEEGQRREAFVANFTHELKTPMTNIIGYADMIRSKELAPDLRFEAANYIVDEGMRLEKMSARLFDLFIAKYDKIDMSAIYIADLLQPVYESVLPSLDKKNLELVEKVEPVYILGDKEMLQSVLINFIDNAIKASNAGSEIILDCYRNPSGNVRLEITDQGCGIPESEIEKIKDAFYMVDKSRARKAGGAGLGLAFASKVLELHKVSWQILSEQDIGTTIIMDFMEGAGNENVLVDAM